ncbi:MAG TPA: GNAT family N-acetyltransferase [Dehalococcoidia bacterium]
MSIEYRFIKDADYEEIAKLQAVAFYSQPREEDTALMRKYYPPEWTVAAFDDGKPVASVRTLPGMRLMHGSKTPFGLISPVTCYAAYRRQGHVAELLRRSLELMKERGQPISGLYTPHDALYRRYGWERAEEKRRLSFDPGDIRFRTPPPAGGVTRPVTQEDWARLDTIYRRRVDPLNGALVRIENWWRFFVLTDFERKGQPERDIVVWVDESGEDRGYVVYQNRSSGQRENGWDQQEIWIRDFTALDAGAYRGLWQHILTHDLAINVVYDAHPDDPFVDLCEDPFEVKSQRAEGPMIRVVDVEGAIASRPYVGGRSASFTMAIRDESAPWNEGVWRVDAAEGQMRAEKTDAPADVELSVNFLAPLYTGFRTAETLASAGMITVNRSEALAEITNAFSVTDPPYTQDFY